MIGELEFQSGNDYYVGSGTVIAPKSVLTAGHVLWDPQTGYSYNLKFTRALYDDNGLSQLYATGIYLFGGYATYAYTYGQNSIQAFAHDMGGMTFAAPLAGGAYVGWWQNPATLSNPASYVDISLGYGAVYHDGSELLAVFPTKPFSDTSGAFYENFSMAVEGGMSGGPVMAQIPSGYLFVVAVVVSGSDYPIGSGVHAIDAAGATFISTYLSK